MLPLIHFYEGKLLVKRTILILFNLIFCVSSICAQEISLTDVEKQYIRDNPVIHYGYDPSWKPLEFRKNGKHVGVSRDYLDLVEKSTGLKFAILEEIESWSDSERLVAEGKLKMLPLVVKNDRRDQYMNFSDIYFSYPFIIATRKDGDFIGSVKDFDSRTIAMPKDYAITDYVEAEDIDVKIIYKNSLEECLMAVSTGEADATAGNLCVISYFLNYKGFQNLKISAPTGYDDAQFRVGVVKSDSVLLGIMEKAVFSVTDKQKNEIVNNWVSVKYEHGVDMAKIWKIVIISALVVLFVVSFMVIWNRKLKNQIELRVKAEKELQTSFEEITNQKKLIEGQHLEITDSIHYAKRIQTAILPSDSYFQSHLEDSFIIYEPKDIVAGDFYWMEDKPDGTVIFAVADCTGHGVPGAMVSVVCFNAMNRSVREFGLTEPGAILNKTRELVIRQFAKSEEDVKDGMDIALCTIKGNQLMYAGAHNPLWIIRNNELIEIKANKEPIGKFREATSFKTHFFDLEKGDLVYLSSDGYPDQFGGPKGKKFYSKNLKKLLLEIHQKNLNEQEKTLLKRFNDWKGNEEQLDDVCLIGVRI